MPLKIFGSNRMIAQQPEMVGAGSENLVKHRPTRGMGPVGMPGASDYNPTAKKSTYGRRGAPEPNAYERSGLFWTGHSVAQGRPLAVIEQGMELAESENVRRIAETAIRDKSMGIHAKDVTARLRQTDEGLAQKGRGLQIQENLGERRLEQTDRELAQREGTLQFNRDRALASDKRDDSRDELSRLGMRGGDQFTAASRRDYAAGGSAKGLQVASVTDAHPGQFLTYYARLTGVEPESLFVGDGFTPEGSLFLDLVDGLAQTPELQGASAEELSSMAVEALKDPKKRSWIAKMFGKDKAKSGSFSGTGLQLGAGSTAPMTQNKFKQSFLEDQNRLPSEIEVEKARGKYWR
jgi:hypothetical protein